MNYKIIWIEAQLLWVTVTGLNDPDWKSLDRTAVLSTTWATPLHISTSVELTEPFQYPWEQKLWLWAISSVLELNRRTRAQFAPCDIHSSSESYNKALFQVYTEGRSPDRVAQTVKSTASLSIFLKADFIFF